MKHRDDATFEPKRLIKLGDLPEAPCDACENWLRCKKERIACTDFFHFVQTGKILGNGVVIERKKYTIRSDRTPCKRLFNKTYRDAIDAPIKVIPSTESEQDPTDSFLLGWGFCDYAPNGG